MQKIFLMTVLLFAMGAAGQNSYYVALTGSDSSDGSQTRPWRTINHADSVVAPGDTVHVAPGTYGSVRLSKAGTSTSRITYVSDTKWGAKVPPVVNLSGSYTTFKNFEIDGTLSGNVCCGIDSSGTTALWIIGNKIHDTASAGNSTGTCVICVDAGAVGGGNHTIDGNFLYHNNGGASGSTPNNSGQHGIYSELSGDIIRNNIVVDQGGGWCIHSWHKVDQWTVVNNIVANCPNGGIVLGDDGATGVVHNNNTINNNIVINSGNSTTGNGGINFRACGSNNIIQNNLMYGNIPGNFVGSCGTSPLGTLTGTNSTTFVNYTGSNPGTADFHPKTGSNTIDNGAITCSLTAANCAVIVDFDLNTRPQGTAIDVGAFEFLTTAATLPDPPTGLTAVVH
jgi:hypothetical protein